MKIYEEVNIEIILLQNEDVITTSPVDGGFNGEGDKDSWAW